jgi:hypothetical protein
MKDHIVEIHNESQLALTGCPGHVKHSPPHAKCHSAEFGCVPAFDLVPTMQHLSIAS